MFGLIFLALRMQPNLNLQLGLTALITSHGFGSLWTSITITITSICWFRFFLFWIQTPHLTRESRRNNFSFLHFVGMHVPISQSLTNLQTKAKVSNAFHIVICVSLLNKIIILFIWNLTIRRRIKYIPNCLINYIY